MGIRWGLIGATLLSLAGANPEPAYAQGTNLALASGSRTDPAKSVRYDVRFTTEP